MGSGRRAAVKAQVAGTGKEEELVAIG
jgi:hypothetical protein